MENECWRKQVKEVEEERIMESVAGNNPAKICLEHSKSPRPPILLCRTLQLPHCHHMCAQCKHRKIKLTTGQTGLRETGCAMEWQRKALVVEYFSHVELTGKHVVRDPAGP